MATSAPDRDRLDAIEARLDALETKPKPRPAAKKAAPKAAPKAAK